MNQELTVAGVEHRTKLPYANTSIYSLLLFLKKKGEMQVLYTRTGDVLSLASVPIAFLLEIGNPECWCSAQNCVDWALFQGKAVISYVPERKLSCSVRLVPLNLVRLLAHFNS